jgi:hypothetical protein
MCSLFVLILLLSMLRALPMQIDWVIFSIVLVVLSAGAFSVSVTSFRRCSYLQPVARDISVNDLAQYPQYNLFTFIDADILVEQTTVGVALVLCPCHVSAYRLIESDRVPVADSSIRERHHCAGGASGQQLTAGAEQQPVCACLGCAAQLLMLPSLVFI